MSSFKSVTGFSNDSYLGCRVISLSRLLLQMHTRSSVSHHLGRLRPTSSLCVCWPRGGWFLLRPQSCHLVQAANFSSASLARNLMLSPEDLNQEEKLFFPQELRKQFRKSWSSFKVIKKSELMLPYVHKVMTQDIRDQRLRYGRSF